jgi:hypothetical protein
VQVAIREITKNKDDGNRAFKGNKIKNEALRAMKINQAIGEYGKGIETCDKYFSQMSQADPLFVEYQQLLRALLGNRVLAYMARGNKISLIEALQDSERAVEVDGSWGKGYYRCGTVLLAMERR